MSENNSCIVCGSTNDLDTELTITVDDQKVTVKVCAEHADDITPKAAKAAYIKWKSDYDAKLKEFYAQAAALGMTVVPQGSGLVIATANQKVIPKTEPSQSIPNDIVNELHGSRDDGVLPTSEVDAIMQRRVLGVSGSVDGTGVERHDAYDPDNFGGDKLPDGARNGLVKMELAEGRHGTPLAIPAIRQDGLGTTRVRIAKTMTDEELQRRFKQQAYASVADESGMAHSFKDGYDIRACSMCKGEGQIKKSQTETIVCPKCNGAGVA